MDHVTPFSEQDLFALADRGCLDLNTVAESALSDLRQKVRQAGYRGVPWDDAASLNHLIRRYAQAIQAYVQGREQLLQTRTRTVTRKGRGVADAHAAMAGEQVALVAWVVDLTPGLTVDGRQRLVDLYLAWVAGRAEGFGTCMGMIQKQLAEKPTASLLRLWHRMVIPAKTSIQASRQTTAVNAAPSPAALPAVAKPSQATPGTRHGVHAKRGIEAALGFLN